MFHVHPFLSGPGRPCCHKQITKATLRVTIQLLFLLMPLTGCGDKHSPGVGSQHQAAPTPQLKSNTTANFPLTVVDSLQRQVTIPRNPRRIISLSPKNTELLFAIGAGSRVVGVTTYCNYPPEAQQCDRVGGFMSSTLSLEKIIALKPDLVVSVGNLHAAVIADLDRLHIPVLATVADSFDGLCQELELLGRITKCQAGATAIVDRIRSRIARVKEAVKDIPDTRRLKVLYQAWDAPLTAAGPGSYIGEMIEICGAMNLVRESASYVELSEEEILNRNPDVILIPSLPVASLSIEHLLNKPTWSGLNAVRNKRIHCIEDDLISRCGPRLVDALDAMAAAIYPNHFVSKAAISSSTDPSREEHSR